jgi:hypothetical protein
MEWGSNLQVGRLCSWDRSSAGGLVVLFAGVGFFNGTASAMANEIDIPFVGVQVLCGGASGVASEVWYSPLESVLRFVSLVVQPI